MKILVACEHSGRVRRAMISAGHDAVSCDLLPADDGGKHHQGCVLDILLNDWDAMIAFPPCTFLTVSGLHWNKRNPVRAAETEKAIRFVEALWSAPIRYKAIENPIGCLSTKSSLGKPSQIIQPYWFGEDASKQTCLWIDGLPKLKPTGLAAPRLVKDGPFMGKLRWSNQTDSGQNKLPPSDDRAMLRSLTYYGIADAMGDQWGAFLAAEESRGAA